MRQIAILSNPDSTRNRTQMPAIRAELEQTPNVFHFEIGSIEDVPEALARFAAIDPLMIVVSGGDGTVQAVLSDLLYHKPFGDWPVPPLAILPSGKTNLIALDLNCGGPAPKALRKLLDLAASGLLEDRVVRRHLIEMDLGDGQQPRVGMFFGAAATVNALHYTREKLHPLGLPNWLTHGLAVWKFVRAIFRGPDAKDSPLYTHRMGARISGDEVIEGKFAVVIATTLDRLLLRMRPYTEIGRGGLKFTMIEHRTKPIFAALWAVLRDNFVRRKIDGCHARRADMVELITTDQVTLDGEIYAPVEDKPIILRGDRILRFVRL